jgi:hypothetical protein
VPGAVDRKSAAERLSQRIGFAEAGGQVLSPADMLLVLLNVAPEIVDGPAAAGITTCSKPSITDAAFRDTTADAADFVRRMHRLPNQVFVGAETLSLADFAATLAASVLDPQPEVPVVRGNVQFDRYFAADPRKPFNWVIHPEGFSGGPLLELGRLQGWTLKPARLRVNTPKYFCSQIL